jgi:hypothetical protein
MSTVLNTNKALCIQQCSNIINTKCVQQTVGKENSQPMSLCLFWGIKYSTESVLYTGTGTLLN